MQAKAHCSGPLCWYFCWYREPKVRGEFDIPNEGIEQIAQGRRRVRQPQADQDQRRLPRRPPLGAAKQLRRKRLTELATALQFERVPIE